MKMTITMLASYLGRDASALLSDLPFCNWSYTKSAENDLAKKLIDYVFKNEGIDFVCDEDNRVNSIFIYSEKPRVFSIDIEDLPLTSSRPEVIACLGYPSKSGSETNHPVLGKFGAWDRFVRAGYVIHVEYRIKTDIIGKLTLMRGDVVPDK